MAHQNLEMAWLSLWERLDAKGDPLAIYNDLKTRYSEPHRCYHNLKHIEHCLKEFQTLRSASEYPDVVELAIWFHDAICVPGSKYNEGRSAKLAHQKMKKAGVDPSSLSLLSKLIYETKHGGTPYSIEVLDHDIKIMVDVDLAILGQPKDVFLEYEKNIRNEYSSFSDQDFRAGRAKVLRSFLDRSHIYWTSLFMEKYEKAARRNLENSLRSL
jgi:predicted metal-dependent HD superfamily phosphohydrolase